jgi:hypothetical protein
VILKLLVEVILRVHSSQLLDYERRKLEEGKSIVCLFIISSYLVYSSSCSLVVSIESIEESYIEATPRRIQCFSGIFDGNRTQNT